jgi:hypothetical protein
LEYGHLNGGKSKAVTYAFPPGYRENAEEEEVTAIENGDDSNDDTWEKKDDGDYETFRATRKGWVGAIQIPEFYKIKKRTNDDREEDDDNCDDDDNKCKDEEDAKICHL